MNIDLLEEIISQIRACKILVVGDLMVDEYMWGQVKRISPEAPVQVVEVTSKSLLPGGCGNVVTNLLPYCSQVFVAGVVGQDHHGGWLRKYFTDNGANIDCLQVNTAQPTTLKTRVLAGNQQIVRIDQEQKADLSLEASSKLLADTAAIIPKIDAIILSDYGKGVLTPAVCQQLIAMANERQIPIVVDPKGASYERYNGATAITPNRAELALASGCEHLCSEQILECGWQLLDRYHLTNLMVTRSEEGISLFLAADRSHHYLPTEAQDVFDVTGAGDTVISIYTACLAVGQSAQIAAKLANAAAGVVVGKIGAATVTPAELIHQISHLLAAETTPSKVLSQSLLKQVLARTNRRDKKVVFTNGCFDLLHAGHIRYLQKAATLGDILIVGLNSDDSIRRLKGESRPLISEDDRAHILAALDCIDYVVIFNEDTPIGLIKAVSPDTLVKGADYKPEQVVGGEFVEACGGKIALIELLEGRSTSNIIKTIVERHSLGGVHN